MQSKTSRNDLQSSSFAAKLHQILAPLSLVPAHFNPTLCCSHYSVQTALVVAKSSTQSFLLILFAVSALTFIVAHWSISLDIEHGWALLPRWHTFFAWPAGYWPLDFDPTRKTKHFIEIDPLERFKNISMLREALYQSFIIQNAWGSSDLKVCNIIKTKLSAPEERNANRGGGGRNEHEMTLAVRKVWCSHPYLASLVMNSLLAKGDKYSNCKRSVGLQVGG